MNNVKMTISPEEVIIDDNGLKFVFESEESLLKKKSDICFKIRKEDHIFNLDHKDKGDSYE